MSGNVTFLLISATVVYKGSTGRSTKGRKRMKLVWDMFAFKEIRDSVKKRLFFFL